MRKAFANPDITVATVCGGSLALAMAGLLEGRNAVTHVLGLDVLDATGVNVVRARVVDDGDLVTAGGVTSGLDLAPAPARAQLWPEGGAGRRGTVRVRATGNGVDMSIIGDWDVTIKTPIGSLAVTYVFTESAGALTGSATLRDETVPLQDLAVDGPRATWRQAVTKPMRLNLDFDVTVDGDRLTGHSKAGRLPRSAVNGTRRGGRFDTLRTLPPASSGGR